MLVLQDPNVPWCHYKDGTGYSIKETFDNQRGYRLTKAGSSTNNPFGGDTNDVVFETHKLGAGVRLVIGAENRQFV